MASTVGDMHVRAFWAEQERRLFAMTGMDAGRYQKIILAVRALADELKDVTSVSELESTWERAGEMLEKTATAKGIPVSMLPGEQIAGTAFAMREREIIDQIRHQQRIASIQAAREAGDKWVFLEQAGKIDAGLFDPYRSAEMHLASGLTLMSLVQPDPSSGAPSYSVTVVRLDPQNGDLIDAEPGVADLVSQSSPQQFLTARNAIRTRIDSLPPVADPPTK